jgi:hypothetical protein
MELCPDEWFGVCQCSTEGMEMLHLGEASYYPSLGFYRCGRRLFCIHSFCRAGRHFWPKVLQALTDLEVETLLPDGTQHMFFLNMRTHGMQFPLRPALRGIVPIIFLWRIQRAVRKWLDHRREVRSLTLMMVSHARLGEESELALLPVDLIRQNILVG